MKLELCQEPPVLPLAVRVPPVLRDHYEVLVRRYGERGWTPPELPNDALEASNVVRAMVARLNNQEPVVVRVAKKPLRPKEL